MVYGSKRDRMQVWVDRDVWITARLHFPKESDTTISRVLFNTSLIKVEHKLTRPEFLERNIDNLIGSGSLKRKKMFKRDFI